MKTELYGETSMLETTLKKIRDSQQTPKNKELLQQFQKENENTKTKTSQSPNPPQADGTACQTSLNPSVTAPTGGGH